MPDPTAPVSSAAPTPAATPAAPSPSTPATPAAPVSTPSTSDTGSTGAAPSSEPIATPSDSSTPATPATPDSTPTISTPKGNEPTQDQYPGDVEGFLNAHNLWERGEEVTPPAAPVDAPVVPDDAAPVVPPDPTEDLDAPKLFEEPEQTMTPENLASFLDESPDVKAVLDANPAFKDRVFAMSRENARLAPIGELFPTVEAAQFANETAGKFVGLRTSIASAATPEEMAPAVAQFIDEFKLVDDKGAPILDAAGQPQYGEDLDLFMKTIVGEQSAPATMKRVLAAIEAEIKAGNFASEDAKDQAEMSLAAAQFLSQRKDFMEANDDAPPEFDASSLPEPVRKQLEAQRAEIAAEREKLGLAKAENSKAQRQTQRAEAEKQYVTGYAETAGKFVANFIQQKIADNFSVPRWVMDVKDSDGIPVFGRDCINAFQARINAVPSYKAEMARLQMLPATEANTNARIAYAKKLIADEMPAIMNAQLLQVQTREMKDQGDRKRQREAGRRDARIEPNSSAMPTTPASMTDQQIYDTARAKVEKEFPNASPSEKLAKTLTERSKLVRSGGQ